MTHTWTADDLANPQRAAAWLNELEARLAVSILEDGSIDPEQIPSGKAKVGPAGKQGEKGDPGKDGPEGKQGQKGDPGQAFVQHDGEWKPV